MFRVIKDYLKSLSLRAVSRKKLNWSFFDVKMRQNGFFFRNPHEKLREKNVIENFFSWSYGGQKSESFSHISEKKCHTLTININR